MKSFEKDAVPKTHRGALLSGKSFFFIQKSFLFKNMLKNEREDPLNQFVEILWKLPPK